MWRYVVRIWMTTVMWHFHTNTQTGNGIEPLQIVGDGGRKACTALKTSWSSPRGYPLWVGDRSIKCPNTERFGSFQSSFCQRWPVLTAVCLSSPTSSHTDHFSPPPSRTWFDRRQYCIMLHSPESDRTAELIPMLRYHAILWPFRSYMLKRKSPSTSGCHVKTISKIYCPLIVWLKVKCVAKTWLTTPMWYFYTDAQASPFSRPNGLIPILRDQEWEINIWTLSLVFFGRGKISPLRKVLAPFCIFIFLTRSKTSNFTNN